MNKFISICLIIWAMPTMSSCKDKSTKGTTPLFKVETSIAQEQFLCNKMWFSTITEPLYSVTIEPRVNGYLKYIHYKSGAPITKGDIIFEIDPSLLNTSYYSALASLESAQATFIEAENNYHRAIPLAKIDAISQSSLDEYTAAYAAARSNVKAAEESLKSAQLNLSYSSITAPIDGLIADSPAALGDYVGPNTEFATLTTISNIDTIKLPLSIPTSQYLKYESDNSYDNRDLLSHIKLILSNNSEYDLEAQYDYTQKDVSPNNSTVVIYAKVANPDRELKANMFTRVQADIGTPTPKIMIPQKAVTQLQGVNSVWVIKNDSTATFRVVELGNTYGNDWHVVSGLNSGERVATSAQLKLHEGAKISPIKK